MPADSDFGKKLLHDLCLRKRKMAAAESSAAKTIHFTRGGSQGNPTPLQLADAVESGSDGSSNQIVLYKHTRSSKQIKSTRKAIVCAFQNMISLTKMSSSGSSESFFGRFKRGSVIFRSRKGDNRSFSMDATYPVSQYHISDIWKGVEKLKQTMQVSSDGVNFDRKTVEIVEQLLRGEVSLDEALRMLVNQQDSLRQSRVKEEEDEDKFQQPPRFSFDLMPKKPASQNMYKFLFLEKDFCNSKLTSSTEAGEKHGESGRLSIAVARLMGLKQLPVENDKVDLSSNRSEAQRDEDVPRLNLPTVKETVGKEGKKTTDSGILSRKKCLRNAEEEKHLKLKAREEQFQKQSRKQKDAVVNHGKESKPEIRNRSIKTPRSMDAEKPGKSEITMPSARSSIPQITNNDKKKAATVIKKQGTVISETSTEADTTKQQSEVPRIENTNDSLIHQEPNHPVDHLNCLHTDLNFSGEGHVKSMEQRMQLTEKENELKEVVISNEFLLRAAEALFNLGIPINRKDEASKKTNLIIDFIYEMMKRRARKYEAMLHPYNPISTLVSPKFKSLDEMVKELCKDINVLKFYRGYETEDTASCLRMTLETDIIGKEYEGSLVTGTLYEKEATVGVLEKHLVNRLLNELLYDIVYL